MKTVTQWLFEAPTTWETNLDTQSDFDLNSQQEAAWESWEGNLYRVPLAEDEWEAPSTRLPGFSPTEEKALRITTTFETGRALGFGGLTGNFDGMGLSFGLLQWNFGSGSLQPLLLEFAQTHPQRFTAVFGADTTRLRQILHQPKAAQLAFARSINNTKNRIIEPWSSYFRKLEADSAFQQIQLNHVRPRLKSAANYAQKFQLRSERAFALMFDIVTQSGSAWLTCKREVCQKRARLIDQRRTTLQQQLGRSLTERELLTIIANVVADTSLPKWREDVRKRKLTIVNGVGTVHGRAFDLTRNFGLTDQPWQSGQSTMPSSVPNTPSGRKSFQQKVAEIARKEWEFFGRGKKKENQEGFWQRVGIYWREAVGAKLDGRNSNPWSAAFISWVMKKAGAGNRFKYSARHSVYIRDAIAQRKNNQPSAAFKGYRLHEVAPQVGDLVCASRGDDAGKVDYDTTRDYQAHCDVVVATRSGAIDVIGGNVNNSVSMKTLKVDAQGKLTNAPPNWFVVIKNLL
ncbi:MAG: DUF2272 domain-containing protein [Stenomitos frigidus ULC029]